MFSLPSHAAEAAIAVARAVRARRLAMNLSQQGLAERAGVSLGSLKRFERTGEIAFVSLLRLADVLEATAEFQQLFPPKEVRSLDDLLTQQPQRQRGRRT